MAMNWLDWSPLVQQVVLPAIKGVLHFVRVCAILRVGKRNGDRPMEVALTILDHAGAETGVILHRLPAILGRDETADVHLKDPRTGNRPPPTSSPTIGGRFAAIPGR